MPLPEAKISSITLAAWEHGPLREIVETEFEMAVIDAIGKRGVRLTMEQERALHDAIVPDICLLAIEKEFIIVGAAHPGQFLLQKQHELQRDIAEKLESCLRMLDDRDAELSDGDPAVMGQLLLAFRRVPSRIRKFLSP